MDLPVHQEILPHICSRFDCLVGFSKGESTWLPGLELAALNKPIIQLASNCSGFMDYLSKNRYMCRSVEYVECDEELYEGTSEYYTGEKMAKGDYLELAEKMRQVYDERETSIQRVSVGHIKENVKEYTWKRTVNLLMERL